LANHKDQGAATYHNLTDNSCQTASKLQLLFKLIAAAYERPLHPHCKPARATIIRNQKIAAFYFITTGCNVNSTPADQTGSKCGSFIRTSSPQRQQWSCLAGAAYQRHEHAAA
jgi:hypothetical protein